MTIKEVKEYYKGQYVECEIYRFTDFTHRVHSDFIYTPDDVEDDQYNENEEVVYEELMDEEEYGRTVPLQIVMLPQISMIGSVTRMLKSWLLFSARIRQNIGSLTKEQKS